MKNKVVANNKGLTVISVVLIALLAIIVYKLNDKKTPEEPKKVDNKAINMGVFKERVLEMHNDYNFLLLSSYEEYNKYFDNDKLTESDFKDNNYVLIEVDYDECSESDVKLEDYNLKDDIIVVNFSYTASCGLCAPQYIYYLVSVDKDSKINDVETKYKATNKPNCPRDVAYKPMIYLYPDKEMNITVRLGNKEVITSSYPKYEEGWSVKAFPSGKLIDNNTGRELYGLYWEGNRDKVEVQEEGFIVNGEDTMRLEVNKYNYIRFETKEEIDSYMPLEINPKPDNVIRILMDYKALDKKIKVKEQVLETPERTGYTVVEWGGTEIN